MSGAAYCPGNVLLAAYKRQQNPELRSALQRRDEELGREIERVYDENKRLYGAKKVWLQLRRKGINVVRCTVERLMRAMGLVVGIHAAVKALKPRVAIKMLLRRMRSGEPAVFMAEQPNQLWVADFTYVKTV